MRFAPLSITKMGTAKMKTAWQTSALSHVRPLSGENTASEQCRATTAKQETTLSTSSKYRRREYIKGAFLYRNG